MDTVDRDAITRAVEGDRDALVALLERHGPVVERSLNIGPRWRGLIDSGDVMQVTYIEAFLQIRSFDVERANGFPSWLRRIAENNLRDAVRAFEARDGDARRVDGAGREESHLGLMDLLASSLSTPSAGVRDDEARELLHAALDTLPEDYAQAVRLYDLEGRPIAEVAEALGRSAGAVHMLRLRAYDRLRELLGSPSRILDTNT